jgi:L-seryl-tRNA(Ser) seleniumtransferase
LVDLARFGLPHEQTPAQTITAGADLVTFSGDKLLGGPQAGIIVGRASLVAAIKKNPMKRAMRCDKLTIAALGAVLRLYTNPERLVHHLPVLRLLTRPQDEIEALARRVQPVLSQHLGMRAQVDVVPVMSQIGSGSLPVDLLPGFAVRIKPIGPKKGSGRWLDQLASEFRKLPIPVIGRIAEGAFLLDLRCLEDEAGFLAMLTPSPE